MSPCTCCRTRPAPTGHRACTTCTRQLRTWLRELPGHLPYLHAVLAPEGRPATGRLRAGGRPGLPLRLDVLTLLGPGHPTPPTTHPGDQTGPIPVLAWLGGWAGYIAYQHPAVTRDAHGTAHTGPCTAAAVRPPATATAWCRWLTAYLPYATTQPWIADLHHQLQTLTAAITRITGTPGRRTLDAPCPSCAAFALVDHLDHLGTEDTEDIVCDVCDHRLSRAAAAAHAAAVHRTTMMNTREERTGS